MRKITLLFALLLSAIGTTAWAQTVIHVTETGTNTLNAASITSKATAGDLYVSIMNHTTTSDKYITSNGTMAGTFDAQNGATTWKVVPYNGAYVLQNYATKKYFGGTSRPAIMVDNIDDATLYEPQDTEAGVGNINPNYNSNQSVRWKVCPAKTSWINTNGANESTTVMWNGGTGNWTCLFTYEVTLSSAYDVTYKVVDNHGNELFTSAPVATPDGTQITELPSEFKRAAFYDYSTIDQTVSSTNTEFTFVATEKANPYMHYSADFAHAAWYNLKIRGQYMTHNVSGVNEIALSPESEPFADKSSWALIGNPYEGFSVVNKDKGEGYYLVWTTVVDGPNKTTNYGDDAKNIQFKSTAEDAEAANKKWILEQNNCSTYPGGFVLRMKDNTNIYFHHNNDEGDGNKFLRTCAFAEYSLVHNDNGSTIVPTTDEEAFVNFCNAMEGYATVTYGSNYGEYTTNGIDPADAIAIIQDAVQARDNNEITSYAAHYAELKSLGAITLNMPQVGDFVRIKSNLQTGYYLSNGSTTVGGKERITFTDDASGADVVYYFDGTYLTNLANGKYIGQENNFTKMAATGEYGTTIIFKEATAKGLYNVAFRTGGTRTLYAQTDGSNYYTDAGGQGSTGTGYDFILEKVTALPQTLVDLTLNGGDACYSTLYMPVAVQVNNAQAFGMQLVGEDLRAIEIEGGKVPANTGVILKGNTTDITLTPIETADAVSSELTGSVQTIGAVSGAYVFSIVGGDLGFYSFGGDELKGFKAYYVSASPVQGFKLNFGDVVNAINQAETTKAGQAIYDLSGRRVEKAVKGVYIVGGKKVIK